MEEIAPNITVVIPVFNGANYLDESLQSVLAQTYRDFEIIVVDDGSTDETWATIERYLSIYPNLVRGLRKANGGVSSALNAGIRAAKGKYFAWLSHDDLWLPSKLEKQIDLLRCNPEAVGVYTDFSFIDPAGERIGCLYAPWYAQTEMMRHLLQLQFISGSTILLEQRCLLELGLFDETRRFTQELDMWMKLIIRYPLAHVPELLTQYRFHPQQTTIKQQAAIRREMQTSISSLMHTYTIQQIFPELNHPGVNRAEFANAYLYLGDVCIRQHACLQVGIRQYWNAWQVWPNWKNPALGKIVNAIWQARNVEKMIRKWRIDWDNKIRNKEEIVADSRAWNEPIKYRSIRAK